jgi:cytochrome P450
MPTHMLDFIGLGDWAEHPSLRLLFTSILTLNPPDHTRLRRLVSTSFTARRVRQLRPAVERLVDDLLDGVPEEGDFVSAFAFPLPVNVIGELLGVPAEDRAQFQPLIRDWTQVLDVITPEVLATADPAAAQVRDYLTGLVERRRREPRNDLISALVAAEAEGDRLTSDELLTMAALLFAAGFETTTNLLANSVVALLHNPDQHRLIGAPNAVEELLRYDSPLQRNRRVVAHDLEFGGKQLKQGQLVLQLLGAANRDPAQFPAPDQLDVRRTPNAHLAFGRGIHFCLGAPLARLEAPIAISTLLRRFPELRLATDRLDWWPERGMFRGLKALPVTF